MATNFPTGLDDFANYVDGTTIMEAAILNDMQFAIEALQAKVGIDGSGVSSSHDYKLTEFFGDWTNQDSAAGTLIKTEVYKVGSAGVVIAIPAVANATLTGLTDGSNPPTTVRSTAEHAGGVTRSTILMPVRKDDYWKVTATDGAPAIYWLPIGSGTCVKQ